MDEDLLVRKDGMNETNDAIVRWVEYRLNATALELRGIVIPDADPEKIVHRSAHIEAKRGIACLVLAPED